MLKLLFLYILLHYNCFCLSSNAPPEIHTPLGTVRGFWKTSLDGRKFAAFEGIPYAKPPVGELRFEEPQPAAPWSGTWEANQPHICPQLSRSDRTKLNGEEDCLYLNVYLPAEFLTKSSELNVIVTIHGGAFMIGDGQSMTRPEWFMDRDIVLVSINYRLGIFGFLSTEDAVLPGNNGLKDQVVALKWVRDNIRSFKGNASSVTITGLSAGGASVHLHYLSPLSRGLFHKGVSQSGTALCPWVFKEKPLESAKKLAALLGCPDKSTRELKHCLKQRPMRNLMREVVNFYGYDKLPFSPFAPVVETGARNPFLYKEPYRLLRRGEVVDVPWITSTTTDDGFLPVASYWTKLDILQKKWTEVAHYVLDYNYTLPVSKRSKVADALLKFYLGVGERIDVKNFKKLTKLFSDRYYALPAELAARLQSKANKLPVYFYLFNYQDGVNKAVEFLAKAPGLKGVGHGEDGIYCYGFFFKKPFSVQDKRMRDEFHDMFYTFASTGAPSFGGSTWRPTGYAKLSYLNITRPNDVKLVEVEEWTPIEFWNSLGIEKNGNLNQSLETEGAL